MDLKAIQAALIFGGGKADDSGRDNAPSDWVEAVCERFTTSGETITCSPLAGRALAVTVQGKTTQAGEGKARPDNIRALSGLGESGTLTLTAEGGKTRTQLDKKAPDGSTSLVMYWEQMKGLDPLKDDIHLPGWDSSYTQDEVRELISAYGEIGEEGLWANLERFLKKVIPVAEECGVKMAIHPDDPPYPIFGLPRIITCEANLDRFLKLVDSPANCLCLCTGSLGCAKSNDVVAMVRKYSAMGRIAFMHIRNVKIMEDGSFEERAHLSSCGSLDMYQIVNALVETGFDGYVRPDHGRMIWGETGKPGYGLYDRALGAAYINGLFEACEKAKK